MKGIVYKLWSSQTDLIYIGSTKNKYLSDRMWKHRQDFKNQHHYITSFNLMKYIDVKIECLEIVEFNDIHELRAKEGEWIRKTKCVNKLIAGRTNQEWRNENKEYTSKKNSEYYEKNKEQVKERCKINFNIQFTCKCGCELLKGNLSRHLKTAKHFKLLET